MNKQESLEFINRFQEKVKTEVSEAILDEKLKLVNRVRKGKVQRRKKVDDREGFTVKDGKSKRISPAERRRRSIAQKKGARKRRGKQTKSNRNRKISLRKSKRLT